MACPSAITVVGALLGYSEPLLFASSILVVVAMRGVAVWRGEGTSDGSDEKVIGVPEA